jgi:hypothetical protein
VLLEARYRIENVRRRTVIRSQVLGRVLKDLRDRQVPLAAPRIQVVSQAS